MTGVWLGEGALFTQWAGRDLGALPISHVFTTFLEEAAPSHGSITLLAQAPSAQSPPDAPILTFWTH